MRDGNRLSKNEEKKDSPPTHDHSTNKIDSIG